MAQELPFTVVGGRLVADLEARATNAGKTFATGRVAHSNRVFNKQTNTYEDGDTSFYNITIFGPSAEHALASLQKGDRVNVVGTLKIRTFTRKDGTTGTSADITVTNIGPDLAFNDVQVDRSRSGGQNNYGNQNRGGFQGNNQGGFQGNQGQPAPEESDPWTGGQPAAEDPFTQSSGQGSNFGGW